MAQTIDIKVLLDNQQAMGSVYAMRMEIKKLQKIDQTILSPQDSLALNQRIGELRIGMSKLKEVQLTLDPGERFRAIGRMATMAAGSIGAVVGVMGAFGVKSESIGRIQTGVMAAISAAMALQELEHLKHYKATLLSLAADLKAIPVKIATALTIKSVTVATEGSTIATKAAAFAQNLWNRAILSNPITILIVGVAALTAGIYLFIKSLKTSKSAFDEYVEKQKLMHEINVKSVDKIAEETDALIKLYESVVIATKGTKERKDAIEALNAEYGKYLTYQISENQSNMSIYNSLTQIIVALKEKAIAMAANELGKDAMKEYVTLYIILQEEQTKLADLEKLYANDKAKATAQDLKALGELGKAIQNQKDIVEKADVAQGESLEKATKYYIAGTEAQEKYNAAINTRVYSSYKEAETAASSIKGLKDYTEVKEKLGKTYVEGRISADEYNLILKKLDDTFKGLTNTTKEATKSNEAFIKSEIAVFTKLLNTQDQVITQVKNNLAITGNAIATAKKDIELLTKIANDNGAGMYNALLGKGLSKSIAEQYDKLKAITGADYYNSLTKIMDDEKASLNQLNGQLITDQNKLNDAYDKRNQIQTQLGILNKDGDKALDGRKKMSADLLETETKYLTTLESQYALKDKATKDDLEKVKNQKELVQLEIDTIDRTDTSKLTQEDILKLTQKRADLEYKLSEIGIDQFNIEKDRKKVLDDINREIDYWMKNSEYNITRFSNPQKMKESMDVIPQKMKGSMDVISQDLFTLTKEVDYFAKHFNYVMNNLGPDKAGIDSLENKMKSFFEKRKAELNKMLLNPAITNEEKVAITEELKSLTGQYEDWSETIAQKRRDTNETIKTEMINASQTMIDNYVSMWAQAEARRSEIIQASISSEKDARLQALEDQHSAGLIADYTYNEEKKKIDDKYAKLERAEKTKAAKQARNIAMYQATIDLAAAIIAQLKNGPFMVAITAALGAAQLGIIRSTPLPTYGKGGMIGGLKHAQGGTVIEAEGGEAIINANSMANPMLRQMASNINQMGGGTILQGTSNYGGMHNIVDEIITKIAAIPVVVSETDITKTQRKVKVIQNQATL